MFSEIVHDMREDESIREVGKELRRVTMAMFHVGTDYQAVGELMKKRNELSGKVNVLRKGCRKRWGSEGGDQAAEGQWPRGPDQKIEETERVQVTSILNRRRCFLDLRKAFGTRTLRRRWCGMST